MAETSWSWCLTWGTGPSVSSSTETLEQALAVEALRRPRVRSAVRLGLRPPGEQPRVISKRSLPRPRRSRTSRR